MGDTQPDALIVADALTCEASFDIHHLAIKAMKEGAALLRTQHAEIERKDALLRQALEAIMHGCPPDCKDGATDSGGTYPWGEAVLMPCPTCETVKAITKELQ